MIIKENMKVTKGPKKMNTEKKKDNLINKKIDISNCFYETGSRKTARAVAYISGESKESKDYNIIVNSKSLKDYFVHDKLIFQALSPFTKLNVNYDTIIKVKGGGLGAQADAIKYAIIKTLCEVNAEYKTQLRKLFDAFGDPRNVERKKVGRYKARKKFPYARR
jgi:small subunit ribosomal protein S9